MTALEKKARRARTQEDRREDIIDELMLSVMHNVRQLPTLRRGIKLKEIRRLISLELFKP